MIFKMIFLLCTYSPKVLHQFNFSYDFCTKFCLIVAEVPGTIKCHILGRGDRLWALARAVELAPIMADKGWPNSWRVENNAHRLSYCPRM